MASTYWPWPDLDEDLRELSPRLKAIRRDIHAHPELGFAESRTQALVSRWLEQLGYQPRSLARTGVVADLHADKALGGPCIALRADLDALPIHEHTPLAHASTHAGVAHKCGHDGHTAILLGVAALLAKHRREVPGQVRLIFQPAEEGVDGGGAQPMIEEGVLHGVDEIYGLHNWPGYPKGQIRVCAGPIMAQVHEFEVRVRGVGGHGSQPQLCRDPIVAASALVSALQTLVSRELSSRDAAVLSVGSFHAGHANNVIPDEAVLTGTIRSFDAQIATRLEARFEAVCEGIAVAYGVKVQPGLRAGYPVLVNDSQCAAAVSRVACELLGEDSVTARDLPMAGGEDFAYYARSRPAAYFFLGAGDPVGETPVCHHPDFDFDDDLIPLGIRMFTGILHERFSRPTRAS